MKTSRVQQIEERLSVSLDRDYLGFLEQLADHLFDQSQTYYRVLPVETWMDTRAGVLHPDAIWVAERADGFLLGLRLPWPGSGEEVSWLGIDPSQNFVQDLGTSVIGICRVLIADLFSAAEILELGEPIRDLNVTATVLRDVGQEIHHRFQGHLVSLDRMARRCSPWPNSRQVVCYLRSNEPESHLIPAYECRRGQEMWAEGEIREAAYIWEKAVRYAPTSVALLWSLGVAANMQGETERAARYFARAVSSDWCSAQSTLPTGHDLWYPDRATVIRNLANSANIDVVLGGLPFIRTIVDQCGEDLDTNATSWREGMMAAFKAENWNETRAIALSGLCSRSWHDRGDYHTDCVRVLKGVYEAHGVGSRAENLV